MFHTICMACIIIGILIPFCSIVLNLFDGFVDFISIDVLQLEFGQDMILDFLPFSINSLCLWSLIFGSLGLILDGRLSEKVIIIIGLVAGYICAVALQSAIKRLKKIENFAAEKEEILLRTGIVSNMIPVNGVGAVSVQLSTGSNVSYPAKSVDGEEIKQDKKVSILRFDGDYVIVEIWKINMLINSYRSEGCVCLYGILSTDAGKQRFIKYQQGNN